MSDEFIETLEWSQEVENCPVVPDAPAYRRAPFVSEPSDAQLIAMIMSRKIDPIGDLINRSHSGEVVSFKPGSTQTRLNVRIERIRYILREYNPTTNSERMKLRDALTRYGVDREVPELKRERRR